MEKYSDTGSSSELESLPTELKQNLKLIRELDDRTQTTMRSINNQVKEFMRKLGSDGKPCTMSEDERKQRLAHIQTLFDQTNKYGENKVQLASETCELVDKQLHRLYKDLASIERKIEGKASSKSSISEEAAVNKGRRRTRDSKTTTKSRCGVSSSQNETQLSASDAGDGNKRKKQKENPLNETRKKGKKSNADVAVSVTPHEPTFCICRLVSYGNMIGCDNPLCSIEWFHFACVGLTTKPKGKWYCPKCRKNGINNSS